MNIDDSLLNDLCIYVHAFDIKASVGKNQSIHLTQKVTDQKYTCPLCQQV
uniref:Uncharacterized protein n=1 Tax=Anguilla anguilla TaxID=7936 RepID=A0A0E9TTJ7_ANGAN